MLPKKTRLPREHQHHITITTIILIISCDSHWHTTTPHITQHTLHSTHHTSRTMKYHKHLAAWVDLPVLLWANLGYVVVMLLLHRWMRHRAAFENLKVAMQVYNVAQVVLCAYMCWGEF